ncbi:MAG: DUF362 domain-containing protein [Candidatus Brocadiia bacterium]
MTATVYVFRCSENTSHEDQAKGLLRLFDAAGFSAILPKSGIVAIKTHFGEGSCAGYPKPHLTKAIVERLNDLHLRPFVTDTNTLYRGNRHNSVEHLRQAREHGFTFESLGCPVIISDGLRGNNDEEVEIDGGYFKRVPIAGDICRSNGMVVLTHLTGHLASGFGASIKNVSMGCASRRGKMMMHSSLKPWVDKNRCVACGECVSHCPEDAISLGKSAEIDHEICIGCGECLTVCPEMAVEFSWKQESRVMQEKMAEVALATRKVLHGRIVYFNVLTQVTKDCDCIDRKQKPVGPDVGIMASSDPVALDRASLDAFKAGAGMPLHELSYPKIDGEEIFPYAAKMGLGSSAYTLEEVGI